MTMFLQNESSHSDISTVQWNILFVVLRVLYKNAQDLCIHMLVGLYACINQKNRKKKEEPETLIDV